MKNKEQIKEFITNTQKAGLKVIELDLEEAKDLLDSSDLNRLAESKEGFISKMQEEAKKVYFIFDTKNASADALALKRFITRERSKRDKALTTKGVKLTLGVAEAESLISAINLLEAKGLLNRTDKAKLNNIKSSATISLERTKQALANY